MLRKGVFARQFFPGCPDSRVPVKPFGFQVVVAFGVPLAFIKALAGQAMRYGDEMEYPFAMDRHGNRIIARAKCKDDHTRTLLVGIILGPTERARDAAKAPEEKFAKKGILTESSPGLLSM